MSVAFRREGDDEHMEPKFELPIPPGPNWVTARGLRLTREKVEALEAVDLSGMAEEDAKKHGRVLRYWRTRLATAELRPVATGDAVAFGCRVTYRINGRDKTVGLVGDDEAVPVDQIDPEGGLEHIGRARDHRGVAGSAVACKILCRIINPAHG